MSTCTNTGLTGLVRQMKGQRKILLLTVLAGVIAQSGRIASLALGGWLTGLAITGQPAQALIPHIVWLGILVIFTASARWWQAWISHDLAFALIEKLQMGIFDGLERAAPGVSGEQRLGDLASVATHDAELMERFYAHTLADYIAAFLVPLAAEILLFTLHPVLALVMLPFLLLVATVPIWLKRLADKQGKQMAEQRGQLNADTVEFIEGHRELATLGQSATFVERLMRRSHQLGIAQKRYGSRCGLEHAAIDLLSAGALLAMLCCTASLLSQGVIATALLPMVLVLSAASLLSLSDVAQTASQLGELRAGARRVLSIMQQPALVADVGTTAVGLRPASATVQFDNVSFAYTPESPLVLNQVSFVIHPGEMVALAGASGAGKTTLSLLLMRFRDTCDGTIFLGGQDIRTLPLADLRQHIALVPQDVHLFNLSVEDNIRLGRPQASRREVIHAARLAQADAFICALPDGYDSVCGERGARLSGGQRQRIAIARALLTEAPVLILDEASSSLDYENERAFHQALEGLRHHRTILLIAHRPATLRQADRVLRLDNGRIR
ncbi:ATP-binding cassette domain-containing protein [Enterobacteriaceae bacterium Kacie_13]|nr:ATP-binding cassette domain-containing protein [Enterobacteriaceae bacterium Kacie_13]